MDRRDHPNQEIEANLIADLQSRRECLRPDPRDASLTIWFIVERVVHVVGQLTVNTDWLHSLQHAVAGSLQHSFCYCRTSLTPVSSIRVTGASPFSGEFSIFSSTSMPPVTLPKTVY